MALGTQQVGRKFHGTQEIGKLYRGTNLILDNSWTGALYTDDFNRANENPISTPWTPYSGDTRKAQLISNRTQMQTLSQATSRSRSII
ncbi:MULTISPECIES: hypothetical protein [Gordonia]|uniref:Uncharacterized protein n=2 Tax=Gordonia TaxID=2053 RepID=A0A9X3I3P8_9ACTN|nr:MULTISPECIES: hypothetical protein [Gordonia]MCF3941126.1 hypothetical protein [Gordonia tangerina]MCX2963165.1 hypothetical protein [Gordonia aquimaris]